MTRLGLRLALAGGRSAVAALLLTALALAAGTAMLLVALAVPTAYAERVARSALVGADAPSTAVQPGERPGRFTAMRYSDDAFRDRSIAVVDVGGVGADPPRPPGATLPAVGELRVSPALAELAAREPLLAQRYPPGTPLLPESLVPSPQTLLAVRGVAAPPDVLDDERWVAVHGFPPAEGADAPAGAVSLVAAIGAAAVLAPIVVLVATATRLTAASRERRMAALRLVGATNAQVARLAAVEALLAGVAGAVAGVGLFVVVRPLAVHLTIGDPWYLVDLMPAPWASAAVVVAVPLVAVLGAQLALARVAMSPLGVGQRARARPVRAWRLLPVAAAVPVLGALAVSAAADSTPLIIAAFALVIASMLLAGPWLVRLVGVVLTRSGSPAAVLAGRRLTTDPRAGFRAVSGGVLGAFAVSLVLTFAPETGTLRDVTGSGGYAPDAALAVPHDVEEMAAAERALTATPGVQAVPLRSAYLPGFAGTAWIGECRAGARLVGADPALCARGRILVAPAAAGLDRVHGHDRTEVAVRGESVIALPPSRGMLPSAIVPVDAVAGPLPESFEPRLGVLAAADDVERGRTALAAAGVSVGLETTALRSAGLQQTIGGGVRLLVIAMLVTYVVAGCSAAVAAATGLLERRRSFALLRLTGTPLGVLRRSAVLELALPLVVVSAVAALLGVLTATSIQLAEDIDPKVPWGALAVPVTAGVLLALALGCSTLPLVRRLTEGEITRFA